VPSNKGAGVLLPTGAGVGCRTGAGVLLLTGAGVGCRTGAEVLLLTGAGVGAEHFPYFKSKWPAHWAVHLFLNSTHLPLTCVLTLFVVFLQVEHLYEVFWSVDFNFQTAAPLRFESSISWHQRIAYHSSRIKLHAGSNRDVARLTVSKLSGFFIATIAFTQSVIVSYLV